MVTTKKAVVDADKKKGELMENDQDAMEVRPPARVCHVHDHDSKALILSFAVTQTLGDHCRSQISTAPTGWGCRGF